MKCLERFRAAFDRASGATRRREDREHMLDANAACLDAMRRAEASIQATRERVAALQLSAAVSPSRFVN